LKGVLPYLFVFISFFGISQSPVDSLRNLIDLTDNPERKVDLLNDLVFALYDYSAEDAIQTAAQALKQSRRVNYKKGESWALLHHSLYYMLVGNIDQSLLYTKLALDVANEINDLDLQSRTTLQLGKVFRDIGRFDSAFYFYKEAEAIQLKVPNPASLMRIYSAISRNYLMREMPMEAIEYAKKGLEQANILNDKQWVGYAWLDLGDGYRNSYDFEKANECYSKARDLYGSYNWVTTDLNESIGISQMMQGNFEEAFKSLTVVMRAYEDYQGTHVLSNTLIKMGEILEEKGLYEIAQEYLDRALKITEPSGYLFLTGEAYYELAWVNLRANQLSSAELNIKKARTYFEQIDNELKRGGCFNVLGLIHMKKKNYDSSGFYHKTALAIRRKLGNKASISSSLFNIGELYLETNKLNEALENFQEGIAIDESIRDQYGLGMYNDRIGRIYTRQNNFVLAENYLKIAIELSLKTSSLDILGAAYNDYSILQEMKGNLKEALHYRKLYQANYDSMYSRGTAQSLISYRTLYDLASKDQQIELLNKDKQIQDDIIKSRNLTIYWIGSISVVLIALIYVLYYYSSRQKKLNMDLSEKNEEIQTQSEELQEANDTLMQLNDEITRQREEIKSQAEELQVSNEGIAKINEGLEKMVEQRTHDLRRAYQELDTFFYRSSHDFRRPLTTLMGLCEVAKMSVKDHNAIELFDKVNTTAINLDKMLMKLQSISDVGSHQLVHKEVFLKQIIDAEIASRQEIIQQKEINVQVDVNLKDVFISYPILVKIIIENLIENAIDFSSPRNPKLSVNAFSQNGSVLIEIKDNGEGIKDEIKPQIFEMFFRGTVRSSGNGLGLYIARKAAQKADGKISFKNNVDGGTTFTVEIPNDHLRSH
jgi:signal transduction histidine kinase